VLGGVHVGVFGGFHGGLGKGSGSFLKTEAKRFFFEEKNQKTFSYWCLASRPSQVQQTGALHALFD
jgi:hypothetical protein